MEARSSGRGGGGGPARPPAPSALPACVWSSGRSCTRRPSLQLHLLPGPSVGFLCVSVSVPRFSFPACSLSRASASAGSSPAAPHPLCPCRTWRGRGGRRPAPLPAAAVAAHWLPAMGCSCLLAPLLTPVLSLISTPAAGPPLRALRRSHPFCDGEPPTAARQSSAWPGERRGVGRRERKGRALTCGLGPDLWLTSCAGAAGIASGTGRYVDAGGSRFDLGCGPAHWPCPPVPSAGVCEHAAVLDTTSRALTLAHQAARRTAVIQGRPQAQLPPPAECSEAGGIPAASCRIRHVVIAAAFCELRRQRELLAAGRRSGGPPLATR